MGETTKATGGALSGLGTIGFGIYGIGETHGYLNTTIFIIIAITIPGRPPPVPKSEVVLLFKSTKSTICAESITCLYLISSFFMLCSCYKDIFCQCNMLHI